MEEFKVGDKIFSPKIRSAPEYGNGEVRLIEPDKRLSVRVSFESGYWKAFTGKNTHIYDILCKGWLIPQD